MFANVLQFAASLAQLEIYMTARETSWFGRAPLVVIFGIAGVMHFIRPEFFLAIVPRWVPWPHLAVSLSGAAEIAGAIGLMFSRSRRAAAWGLVLLLVLVFPANIYMLQQAVKSEASKLWQLALWIRLTLQPLLIWWIWRVALRRRPVK